MANPVARSSMQRFAGRLNGFRPTAEWPWWAVVMLAIVRSLVGGAGLSYVRDRRSDVRRVGVEELEAAT
jgi:hypothetical protein